MVGDIGASEICHSDRNRKRKASAGHDRWSWFDEETVPCESGGERDSERENFLGKDRCRYR